MATRVTYLDKAGITCTAVYPNAQLAAMFARTVRKATCTEIEATVAPVAVRTCPAGTVEAQREATRLHHRTDDQVARDEAREDRRLDSEHSYEREAEFWGAAQAAGQARADTWADVAHMERTGKR